MSELASSRRATRERGRLEPHELAATAAEVILATALATGAVAALQSAAPAAGLGVLYLLSVLAIAIRRGQIAALATAVLSMLTLNYLFIPPRHQLTIHHSQDVVELGVLLIVAVVVGRLASASRERAGEADSRAALAFRREREAALLAEAASAILAGTSVSAQLDTLGKRLARATTASHARVVLEPVPSPDPGEIAMPLRSRSRTAWLYVADDTGWDKNDLERISEPLGRLIDVAVERERLAERAAETEAATRAEIARTAVLHAISHDLRTPLTAITTAGSALRSTLVSETERVELIDVIESESTRLAHLVDDLLDLSKIEAEAVAPQADWCDLHDVVASAAAHLSSEHPIEFSLPSDLPLIRADAAQLERVFSNLLENAIKFSPVDVPVRVTAGVGGGRVTVRVIDQGRGIPAQLRSRVFEPFFRGRGTGGAGGVGGAGGAGGTRGSTSGSGLGLAICRGFVEANGGQIVLQAGRERGSAFAVSFPVAPQPQAVR